MRLGQEDEDADLAPGHSVLPPGGARVSTCASDRNELVAVIEAIAAGLGRPETVLADNGYANGAAVAALEASGIEALVAAAYATSASRQRMRRTRCFSRVRTSGPDGLFPGCNRTATGLPLST